MAAMPRALPWLAPLLSGLLAAQERAAFVLFVRDPSGAKVADATGVFACERPNFLPALRGLGDGTALTARPSVRATSDAQGVLRIEPPADGPDVRAIAGLVTTASGLGAVVGRLHGSRAQKLQLLPMAPLATAGGKGPLTVHARTLLPDGETVELPPLHGERILLPAGLHDVWAKDQDGWTWQRLLVRSGQTVPLADSRALHTLRTPPGARLHPAGRPEVDLLDGRRVATLRGAAARAPLITFVDGFSAGERLLPDAATEGPLDWPPAATAAPVTVAITGGSDEQAAQALLVGLMQTSANTWRIFAMSRPIARRCVMPVAPQGDAWLVLLAPGHAATAVEWSLAGPPATLTLQRGHELVVRARDESGLPIPDLAVDYVPDRMEPATVAGHADARGVARLGLVTGPGVVRISDPRFANQAIELAAVPHDGLPIVVAAGAALRGIARWADGTPAGAVLVTLRDPTGQLRPAQRTVVTGPDGSFAFAGLRENRALVLFAAAQRDGRTWSGKLDRLLAGGEDVDLVLRDEDPQLGPDTGR